MLETQEEVLRIGLSKCGHKKSKLTTIVHIPLLRGRDREQDRMAARVVIPRGRALHPAR